MTNWWPDIPVLSAVRPRGWSTHLETPTKPAPDVGWWSIHSTTATDTGIGQDVAALLARMLAADTGIGTDTGLLQRAELLAADTGIGTDTGLLAPLLWATGQGIGADHSTIGLHPTDHGVGRDQLAAQLARIAATDDGRGADGALLSPRILVTSAGVGNDSGTNRFTPQPAALVSYNTPGTRAYTIPAWCRYLDLVAIGGGGGGHGAGWVLSGDGGRAGRWASTTIERGVHIPWTTTTIELTVGDGGTGGSGGAISQAGSNGQATTIGSFITGNGGARGSGSLEIGRDGEAAGNHTHNGQTYIGGGENTAPGGGGKGGGAVAGNGSKGGAGGAWIRAYQ